MTALVQAKGSLLGPEALDGANWRLGAPEEALRFERMRKNSVPLGEYVKGQVYYGVKTGFNTAFFIDGAKRDELIAADPASAELIKPLLRGRDIQKWTARAPEQWIIATQIGVPIERYPAIFAHLKQWEKQLTIRNDRGPNWWELRACAYYDAFAKPKILYQEIASKPAFAFDRTGAFTNNKAFMIPSDDLYLLGILNSTAAWEFLNSVCTKMVGGALAMQTPAVFQVPIPNASAIDRRAIETLVQAHLEAPTNQCPQVVQELESLTTLLY